MSRSNIARLAIASTLIAAGLTSVAGAQSIVGLASFGVGGWRAPNAVQAGDALGTETAGVYNFLQTVNNERGMAYNPITGNLILVSRSGLTGGATNIRVLSGSTATDLSGLSTTGIGGGAFVQNMVGVGTDGRIYVGNLSTNTQSGGSPFRLYRYDDSLSATLPTQVFSSLIAYNGITAGTPRGGDSLDVIGGGAGTRVAIGYSGVVGYAVIDPTAGTAQGYNAFTPAGPLAGDFRLGITFGATSSDVIGKQTGGTAAAAPLRVTTNPGSATNGTSVTSATLLSGGEMAMDYTTIAGVPYLAVVDANSSVVRIYDFSNPASPALLVSGTTTSGTLAGNGNAVGSVAWGAVSGLSATLYAMSTNQGIQAFTVTVPEPTTLGLLAGAAAMVLRRRSK